MTPTYKLQSYGRGLWDMRGEIYEDKCIYVLPFILRLLTLSEVFKSKIILDF